MRDGITCSDGELMDRTTKGFVIAACSVVIGWGVVSVTKFTITAIAAGGVALELVEQQQQAELQKQGQVWMTERLRCGELYFGQSDDPKRLKQCQAEVDAKFPEHAK